LAIKVCEYYLQNVEDSEKWLKFHTEFPKKRDDLSDTFLQGANYINNLKQPSKRKRKTKK
jgi:hypothetical protein